MLANPPFSQNLNCNVRRHVDNAPPPKPHDVRSHLHGGVPRSELDALERFWTKTKKDCVRGERMPTKVAAAPPVERFPATFARESHKVWEKPGDLPTGAVAQIVLHGHECW